LAATFASSATTTFFCSRLSAIAYLPNWTGFASCYAGPKFLEAKIHLHFADALRHRFGGRPEKILSGITICAG
jgi:hypothetical protein